MVPFLIDFCTFLPLFNSILSFLPASFYCLRLDQHSCKIAMKSFLFFLYWHSQPDMLKTFVKSSKVVAFMKSANVSGKAKFSLQATPEKKKKVENKNSEIKNISSVCPSHFPVGRPDFLTLTRPSFSRILKLIGIQLDIHRWYVIIKTTCEYVLYTQYFAFSFSYFKIPPFVFNLLLFSLIRCVFFFCKQNGSGRGQSSQQKDTQVFLTI